MAARIPNADSSPKLTQTHSPQTPSPEPCSDTVGECQVQADTPGWVAGSLCSGISRALALRGQWSQKWQSTDITGNTPQDLAESMSLPFSWHETGFRSVQSPLHRLGNQNEREGSLSNQGHHPALLRNSGLQALGRALKMKGFSQIQNYHFEAPTISYLNYQIIFLWDHQGRPYTESSRTLEIWNTQS